MSNVVVGVLVALTFGAAGRWFNIPVPAPPSLVGTLLVVSVSLGYVGMDENLKRANAKPSRVSTTRGLYGGPDVSVTRAAQKSKEESDANVRAPRLR